MPYTGCVLPETATVALAIIMNNGPWERNPSGLWLMDYGKDCVTRV